MIAQRTRFVSMGWTISVLLMTPNGIAAQTAPASSTPPPTIAPRATPMASPPVALPPRTAPLGIPRSPFNTKGIFTVPAGKSFANSRLYQQEYQLAQQYGRCAVAANGDRAAQLLAARPNTPTEITQVRLLTSNVRGCLPYGHRPSIVFLRGSVAEALYNQLPASSAARDARLAPADVRAFAAAEAARSKARLVDDRLYATLAECLVLQAPAAVDVLLKSRHGSDGERTAFNTILAQSPGCSNARSFPVAGGRPWMRSYLAESAYRWARFQSVGRRPIG